MKDLILKNKYIILTIIILSSIMFYFINQKQGYHEDEIFSYGSSNYKYDNVYREYGYAEADNDILYKQILTGNLSNKISNLNKYLHNSKSFTKDEKLSQKVPTFRTKEEALEYLVIDKEDIFNYFSVYYNQVEDVHPPLFYFLVHFISCFFYKSFSKYIIFILNLVFFIASLLIIKKIMKELKREELSIPAMILYGSSIGCISTVMFQRMYMMLTFFSLCYLYLTLNYINNNHVIKSKKLWIITILLGFLTQYYFCCYIAIIFAIVSIYLIWHKKFKEWYNYVIIHIIPAAIGIIFYPASITHIFFSYRGVGSSENHRTFWENISYYFTQIYKLLGLQNILLILVLIFTCTLLYKIINKRISLNKKVLTILIVPTIIYILAMSKIAPFLGESNTSRYIMLLFPVIAITIIYLFSFITNKKYIMLLSIIISVNGLINNTPVYLYKDNAQVLKLAHDNSDKYFVYVYDNYFTHLSSMPEFAIYNESIILNNNAHNFNVLDTDKL